MHPYPAWTQIELSGIFREALPHCPVLFFPAVLPQQAKGTAGDPVLIASDGAHQVTLVSQTASNKRICVPWLAEWLNTIRQMEGRAPKPRIYNRIPFFNVNRIPPTIRTFVFETFFQSHLAEPQHGYSSGIQKLLLLLRQFDVEVPTLDPPVS